MSISLTCFCGKKLKAPDAAAGRHLKCPTCGGPVLVPEVRRIPSAKVDAADPDAPEPRAKSRAKAQPPARKGLDGLSSKYEVSLFDWEEIARPHYRKLVGLAVGYFFVFGAILAGVILLHFLFIGFLLDPIVTPALALGFHVASQKLLKGESITFGTFFDGFKHTWPLAGRAVLLTVTPFLLMLPTLAVCLMIGVFYGDAQEKAAKENDSRMQEMDREHRAKVEEMLARKSRADAARRAEGRQTSDQGAPPSDRGGDLVPIAESEWHVETRGRPLVSSSDYAPPPAVIAPAAILLLVNVAFVIYVWIRLAYFSHLLIVDRQCGVIESMKGSWLLSRGHFWGLLGTLLFLMLFVWISGLLTLGIGVLFTLPRAILVINAGYMRVAGSRPPVTIPEPA